MDATSFRLAALKLLTARRGKQAAMLFRQARQAERMAYLAHCVNSLGMTLDDACDAWDTVTSLANH